MEALSTVRLSKAETAVTAYFKSYKILASGFARHSVLADLGLTRMYNLAA